MTRVAAPSRAVRLVVRDRPGPDASLPIAGQAVRAAGHGFTAVLLGALLAALIAGTALASLVVEAFADRLGRRSARPRVAGSAATAGGAE